MTQSLNTKNHLMSIQLHILRHAKPLIDKGICYGVTDVMACEIATETSAKLVQSFLFGTNPCAKWLVICSPLQRCQQLATAIGLPYTTDARLSEMDFGAFENTPWSQISKSTFDDWLLDFGDHCFGGAESTNSFLKRVHNALTDVHDHVATITTEMLQSTNTLLDQDRQQEIHVLWVTHAGVAKAMKWFEKHLIQKPKQVPLVQSATQWPVSTLVFGGCDSYTLTQLTQFDFGFTLTCQPNRIGV